MLQEFERIERPVLSDIDLPSSSSSAVSSVKGSAGDLHIDGFGYTLPNTRPFEPTRKKLERKGGVQGQTVPDGISPKGPFSTGLLSNPSSKAPSHVSSKAPSHVSSKATYASSKATSNSASSKATSVPGPKVSPRSVKSPAGPGAVKVLPDGPIPPLSPVKTPTSHASKKTTTSHHPRSDVPTPAPSVKPVISKGVRSGPRPKKQGPMECHIAVDDRPDIPLKAKIPTNVDGSKWLNHRPIENLIEGTISKTSLSSPVRLQKFGMSQSNFT